MSLRITFRDVIGVLVGFIMGAGLHANYGRPVDRLGWMQVVNISAADLNLTYLTPPESSQPALGEDDIVQLSTKPPEYSPSTFDWEDKVIESLAEPFPPRLNETWCDPDKAHSGIWLAKIPKTASSVAAAVTIQIARSQPSCAYALEDAPEHRGVVATAHWEHGQKFRFKRDDPSFLWTWVRDPAKRAISHYFFIHVSRNGESYDEDKCLRYLGKSKNFQLNYAMGRDHSIALKHRNETWDSPWEDSAEVLKDIKKKVVSQFQFIGLVERMEESLVVMKLLFGFKDADAIALASKKAGSFDGGGYKDTCHSLVKSNLTAKVEDYLQQEFQEYNYDYHFYHLVNKSLDMTIDKLGRERVEKEVLRHRELARLAHDKCIDEAIFPCVEHGAPPRPESEESCYFSDIGCGWQCVKREVEAHIAASP